MSALIPGKNGGVILNLKRQFWVSSEPAVAQWWAAGEKDKYIHSDYLMDNMCDLFLCLYSLFSIDFT